MYFMKYLKKDGSKFSILFIQIIILFRDSLLGKLNKAFSKTDVSSNFS